MESNLGKIGTLATSTLSCTINAFGSLGLTRKSSNIKAVQNIQQTSAACRPALTGHCERLYAVVRLETELWSTVTLHST